MGQKHKTELMKNLAIEAVKVYYCKKPELMYNEIHEITNYCKCHTRIITKFYQKIHRLEMNNIIVRSVLIRQSEIKEKLIIGRYKNGKSWTALSIVLHTSISQLFVWHDEIISDVQTMMFYQIREVDIFSRRKIMNIIHVINQQIDFLENMDEENQKFLDKKIPIFLKIRKEKYEKLYINIQNLIQSTTNENKKNTLMMRMEDESENISNIAKECNISQPSVSVYLLQFKKEIMEQKDYITLINS